LLSDRHSVAVNPQYPLELDVQRFSDLLAEVVCVEDQAIEYKSGLDITVALLALVSSHTQNRYSPAIQASLKLNRRIKFQATGCAAAFSLCDHYQGAMTLWAAIAQ